MLPMYKQQYSHICNHLLCFFYRDDSSCITQNQRTVHLLKKFLLMETILSQHMLVWAVESVRLCYCHSFNMESFISIFKYTIFVCIMLFTTFEILWKLSQRMYFLSVIHAAIQIMHVNSSQCCTLHIFNFWLQFV